jgi:hypothetical protein
MGATSYAAGAFMRSKIKKDAYLRVSYGINVCTNSKPFYFVGFYEINLSCSPSWPYGTSYAVNQTAIVFSVRNIFWPVPEWVTLMLGAFDAVILCKIRSDRAPSARKKCSK